MKEEKVDLDSIFTELGHFGRYQVRVFCLVLLTIIFSAVYLSQYIFAAGELGYRCMVPECESSPPEFDTNYWGPWALPATNPKCERLVSVGEQCSADNFIDNQTERCTAWVYESDSTIVAEFDFACQEWKRTLVGTIHSAGTLASLPLTAFVSDMFGRRLALVITAVSPSAVGVVRAFSNSYPMYVVLEFLDAMLGNGVYSTGFILALELVGVSKRVLCGNIISIIFAIGQVVAALAAWIFPYWRTYLLFIYAPSILFISYYWLIEESVRWLLSKGRKKEATKIIFKVAAVNKRILSSETMKILSEDPVMEIKSSESSSLPEIDKKYSLFLQVLKSKTIMFRLSICSFWWITLTFVYYGLSINSVSLAGNMYVNYILTCLVEIPGYCLSAVTLDRFGRKKPIMIAFFVCAVSLITLPFVAIAWLRTFLNLIGKLSISMAFSSIYIYTGELFPTQARHSLLGACSMAGRIGGIIAPQTPLLMAYMQSLPYLIFGVMSGTSCLLMLLAPETIMTKLPDTVHQAEGIGIIKTADSRQSEVKLRSS